MSLLYLVDIEAPSGTARYATSEYVDGSNSYEARVTKDPRISRSFSSPADGISRTDDTRLTLTNGDGSLNKWLQRTGGEDIRGVTITIYEVEIDIAGKTQVFIGTVRDATGDVDRKGQATVGIRAETDTADILNTLIPTKINEKSAFTPQLADSVIVTESQGLPFPVCFGATREHVQAVYAKRDPTATPSEYTYIVMHDMQPFLCRGYVNTLYKEESDGLLVVPSTDYTIGRTTSGTFANYVTATFNRAITTGASHLWADIEATEFDSLHTGVKRHWLFRDNLIDETSNVPLLQNTNAIGDWRFSSFANHLVDSSPKNLTLTSQGDIVDSGDIVTEAGGDNAIQNVVAGNLSYFSSGTSAQAEYEMAATDDWYIEARVKQSTGGQFDITSLDGNIIGKMGTRGWSLGIDQGRAFMTVTGNTSTGVQVRTVNATTNMADGNWHTVVGNVDNTNTKMEIYVDGTLEKSIALPTWADSVGPTEEAFGTSAVDNIKLGVCCGGVTSGGNAQLTTFTGLLGRVAVYDTAYQTDLSFTTGQSGQSTSAVSLVSGSKLIDLDSANYIVSGTSDLVVMMWFKRTANTLQEVLAQKWTGTTGWRITLETGGQIRIEVGDGTNTASKTSAVAYDDGAWHQIYLLFGRSGTLELYMDGVSVGSVNSSSVGVLTNAVDLEVNDAGAHTVSDIDELAIIIGSSLKGFSFTGASIRQQYMTATGNPARMIRNTLESTAWGLSQTVNVADFDAAEDEMVTRSIKFGGALTIEEPARDVLNDMLSVYGMVLKTGAGGQWRIFFSWKETAGTAWEFGKDDGRLDNVIEARDFRRKPVDETPVSLSVKYHISNDPSTSARRFLLRTVQRSVNTNGVNSKVVPARFVREWAVADRIADFLAEWERVDLSGTIVVGLENRAITPGDRVTLDAPGVGVATSQTFRVKSESRSGSRVTVDLYEDAPNAPTYTAGTPVPDLAPDSTPDWRQTQPTAPFDLHLFANASTLFGTRVAVKFTMPSDEVAQAIVTGYRLRWKYLVEDSTDQTQGEDTNPLDWEDIIERSASPGDVVLWGQHRIDPNRRVRLEVHSLDRFGKESGPAPYTVQGITADVDSKEGDGDLTFKTAFNSSTTLQGTTGHESRISALEGGGGGGGVKSEILTISGGTATLSADPNIATQEPLITVIDRGWKRVGASPVRGQFTLSGTGNRTVTFGGSVDGQYCYALYVVA